MFALWDAEQEKGGVGWLVDGRLVVVGRAWIRCKLEMLCQWMGWMWREEERKRDEGRNRYRTHLLARLPLVTSCQAGIEVGRKALRNA